VRPAEFERVIVDTTVQEKAIAHPVDSRLLEIARAKVVQAAKQAGLTLKQTFVKEGKELAAQSRRLRPRQTVQAPASVVKRQRTILGIVLREVTRKLTTINSDCATAITRLNTLLERAERIRTQQPKDKNKLYALHAPEVECISKGKARKRYEFGVKASIVVTHKSGLVVGARSFPGNPYDGHILSAQLEQTNILLEDAGKSPKQVFVDLGYRGVDRDNPNVGNHSPRQVQVTDPPAAALSQAPTSRRTDDWASEVGSPNGSLLVARPTRRCAAHGACVPPAITCAGCCGRWFAWD
jgi:IS5 family transposase